MEFDILNELLTSTVYSLFSQKPQESSIQNKKRVKQLERLSRPDGSSSRQNPNDSILSGTSSNNPNSADPATRPIPPCESIEKWMEVQSQRRLKESMRTLGIDTNIFRQRNQLEAYLEGLTMQELLNEKKKVKNELKIYDNDFTYLFNRAPNRAEKEPFRPLYAYYKQLKKQLDRRGGQSREQIENRINSIKNERRELRQKIEQYQSEFQRTHNRRIHYVKDIQPIETQYRRYKDLKTELQRLEEILK